MRRDDDEEVWYPKGMVVVAAAVAVTAVGMPRARRDSRATIIAEAWSRNANDDSLFRCRHRLLPAVHWAVRGLFLRLWLLHLSSLAPSVAVRE